MSSSDHSAPYLSKTHQIGQLLHLSDEKGQNPRMNLRQIGKHISRPLATRLKRWGRQEPDLDQLEADVLDEFSIGLFSSRGHVGKGRQEEESFCWRDVFEGFGKVDFDVGTVQSSFDLTPI